MAHYVIACYRPKAGKEEELLAVLRDHLPLLRAEGLATDRPANVMQAADGTILEVFEWVSQEAVEQAHENERVKALWDRFAEVCEYVPPSAVPENHAVFPDFEPIDAGDG